MSERKSLRLYLVLLNFKKALLPQLGGKRFRVYTRRTHFGHLMALDGDI